MRKCKTIKDWRKVTRVPLNSNFIIGFSDNYVIMFYWPSRNSRVSQTSHWNILESFSMSHKFEVHRMSSECFQEVMFSRGGYWLETQPTTVPGTAQARVLTACSREKQVLSIEVITVYWQFIFLWCPEAHLFRHAQISLPVRGPWKTARFEFIHLIFLFFL